MRVLVLGGGAREHALAWRLSRDESVRGVSIAPGNGGTPAVAETVADLDILNPDAVARHAAQERYDLVVVGPEAVLAAGVADALARASIPVFGPSQAAARLESSKIYAKEQLRRTGVATAASVGFDEVEAAVAYLRASESVPVVKADGLAAGKGVVVAAEIAEAEEAVRGLFAVGPPGARVLLEERLEGREVSVFALVSGEVVVPLAAACDYKRLLDGDRGPNTGGMGAYAPVPWFGRRQIEEAVATIFEPIAWRMVRDGAPYRGVLYAGLMVTPAGPMVLEFNVRFGDPEAQVVLPLLDGDLASALLAVATGNRSGMGQTPTLPDRAAVGVVVASAGYPASATASVPLGGAEPSGRDDAGPLLCFHAATAPDGHGYRTAGGRVATFVGIGSDLASARDVAAGGVAGCRLEGAQARSDIAAREL